MRGRLPVGNLPKRRAAAGHLRDRSNRAWKEWTSAVGLAQIAPTRCWLCLLASARPHEQDRLAGLGFVAMVQEPSPPRASLVVLAGRATRVPEAVGTSGPWR
jgi:hypothetical protein